MAPALDFASDNAAPAHPAVLGALARASHGPAPAYGADALSERVAARVQALLGIDGPVFLVPGGTGANVLGLGTLRRPHEAIICSHVAHIHVDEAGAPERWLGSKLLPLGAPDARLTPAAVAGAVRNVGSEHQVQARVLAITQSTEYGTVYPLATLRDLAATARAHGLRVHLDGARLANALATLGCTPAELLAAADAAVATIGFTKTGAIGVEAVAFRDPAFADGFRWLRKQGLQLLSKHRYLAAQVDALLDEDRWLALAAHANAMARRLADAVAGAPGLRLTQPVEANAVFAVLPAAATARLQADVRFYRWDERTGEVRWMTSWATTEAEVDTFAALVHAACADAAPGT